METGKRVPFKVGRSSEGRLGKKTLPSQATRCHAGPCQATPPSFDSQEEHAGR